MHITQPHLPSFAWNRRSFIFTPFRVWLVLVWVSVTAGTIMGFMWG